MRTMPRVHWLFAVALGMLLATSPPAGADEAAPLPQGLVCSCKTRTPQLEKPVSAQELRRCVMQVAAGDGPQDRSTTAAT